MWDGQLCSDYTWPCKCSDHNCPEDGGWRTGWGTGSSWLSHTHSQRESRKLWPVNSSTTRSSPPSRHLLHSRSLLREQLRRGPTVVHPWGLLGTYCSLV